MTTPDQIRDRQMGDYEALPEAIKHQLSRAEWAWLPDADKPRVVRDMTEPEFA